MQLAIPLARLGRVTGAIPDVPPRLGYEVEAALVDPDNPLTAPLMSWSLACTFASSTLPSRSTTAPVRQPTIWFPDVMRRRAIQVHDRLLLASP